MAGWTCPNRELQVWDGTLNATNDLQIDGVSVAASFAAIIPDLDTRYLMLNASNDPITAPLELDDGTNNGILIIGDGSTSSTLTYIKLGTFKLLYNFQG